MSIDSLNQALRVSSASGKETAGQGKFPSVLNHSRPGEAPEAVDSFNECESSQPGIIPARTEKGISTAISPSVEDMAASSLTFSQQALAGFCLGLSFLGTLGCSGNTGETIKPPPGYNPAIERIFNLEQGKGAASELQQEQKAILIENMLTEDVKLSDGERQRLVEYLSAYPLELIQYAAKSGFKIYILADSPQPPGKLKPSDLGFGDYNGDGKVNPADWVDFNGNGRAEPWEFEGKVGLPDSKGNMEAVLFDDYIDGAYDPGENFMYIFNGLLSEKNTNAGRYTMLHEFAHALDYNMKKDPKFKKITGTINSLYKACKKKNPGHRFLNEGYAVMAPGEYFADAFQAYFTPEQTQDETGKFDISHCYRQNLREKDPAMYSFLDSLIKNPLNPEKWDTY